MPNTESRRPPGDGGAEPDPVLRRRRSRLSSLIGIGVGLAGLAFVARLILVEREAFSTVLRDAQPAWFLAALLLGLLGMTGIGLTWKVIIRHLDRDLPMPDVLRGYFVGQLGKYVPGGFWSIMGRGEWARRGGVSPWAAYSSTVLSMITAYLAASVTTLVGLASGTPPGAELLTFGVAALAPIGILFLHPKATRTALRFAERAGRRTIDLHVPPWSASLGFVARQVPSWLLISGATWAVAQGLGVDLGLRPVLLATCVSWVAGFLFLPVPGGIGVREAVFVATLQGGGLAATVALSARLLFVLVDAVGAGLSSLFVALRPRSG